MKSSFFRYIFMYVLFGTSPKLSGWHICFRTKPGIRYRVRVGIVYLCVCVCLHCDIYVYIHSHLRYQTTYIMHVTLTWHILYTHTPHFPCAGINRRVHKPIFFCEFVSYSKHGFFFKYMPYSVKNDIFALCIHLSFFFERDIEQEK